MNHTSLFSGIGGFDLAAEWMGWNNVLSCEIDPFCNKVLKYYWPDTIHYEDIKKTDFTIHRGGIDILTGGFPCQPFSAAGKRRGTEDARHLWPEMLRAIQEIQPRWVVGENVRGFTNWNGGMVFHQVLSDLEDAGYEVQPFLIPACAVNAPHRRDRIWIVAHKQQSGLEGTNRLLESIRPNYGDSQDGTAADSSNSGIETVREWENEIYGQGFIADTRCSRREDGLYGNEQERQTGKSGNSCKEQPTDWHDFPTQPPLRVRDDGFSSRLDGITFPKLRNESIKAAGNAIVPQIAFQIFKAIKELE
jgi:DNA (cytosine-5)-methyltransferase 1